MRIKEITESCWKGYKQIGMKQKGSKTVPNCVPKESQVDELIQPEIKQQKGFTKHHTDELGLIWTAHSRGEFDLTVDVQSPHMGQIAYITLEVNPDEDSMSSIDTWVHQKFRRMGIATKMYNWAEKLGNTVVKSSTLSRMGKKFWKSRNTQVAEDPATLDDQKQQGIVKDPKTGKWVYTKDPTAMASPTVPDTQDKNIVKSFGTGVKSKIRKAVSPSDIDPMQTKYNLQKT